MAWWMSLKQFWSCNKSGPPDAWLGFNAGGGIDWDSFSLQVKHWALDKNSKRLLQSVQAGHSLLGLEIAPPATWRASVHASQWAVSRNLKGREHPVQTVIDYSRSSTAILTMTEAAGGFLVQHLLVHWIYSVHVHWDSRSTYCETVNDQNGVFQLGKKNGRQTDMATPIWQLELNKFTTINANQC